MRSVEWCDRHGLTPAERAVLFLAAHDVPRDELAARRGVKPSTVKKQVSFICSKTQSRSLDHAVVKLAIWIMAETRPWPFPIPEIDEERTRDDLEPFVCPGCHAVNASCAPGCSEGDLARDLDDSALRDDDEEWAEEDLDGD